LIAEPQFPQIPLPLGGADALTFDLYCAADNALALTELKQVARGGASRNVYLWGDTGTGKSHLLHAACAAAADAGRRAALVPLAQSHRLAPALLEDLEDLDLVCIDDLDAIAGQPAWEQPLFHLFNRMREAPRPLVFAARTSPAGCAIALPDLKSRLGWDLVFRLAPLQEAERFAALRGRAQMRGMKITDEVLNYLSRRIPRDMHSLFAWLERLDRESLAAGKRLTVPFVRDLLERGSTGAFVSGVRNP
jgi:DnaA family protein